MLDFAAAAVPCGRGRPARQRSRPTPPGLLQQCVDQDHRSLREFLAAGHPGLHPHHLVHMHHRHRRWGGVPQHLRQGKLRRHQHCDRHRHVRRHRHCLGGTPKVGAAGTAIAGVALVAARYREVVCRALRKTHRPPVCRASSSALLRTLAITSTVVLTRPAVNTVQQGLLLLRMSRVKTADPERADAKPAKLLTAHTWVVLRR
mmetsp:Transcript_112433/g.281653  ORF Transcript_112433/g.281653 Transcript_112433/m.281653 type:complete len:203 (-) Transcript_112433:1189-1797(-)